MRLVQLGALVGTLLAGACAGRPGPQRAPAEGEGEGEGEGEVPYSEIELAPAECDVGDVPLGASGSCVVSLTNGGPREIEVLSLIITSSADVFALPAAYAGPVQAGATLAVRVTARPLALGLAESALVIDLAGALDPQRTVPLRVTGISEPVCVARVSSVNEVALSPGDPVPALHPLDRVIVALDESRATLTGTLAAFEWQLVSRPAGSTVQLTTPTAVDTGFIFDDQLGLDLPGPFQLRAAVFDSGGSSATCDLEIVAAPPPDALQVQLLWDSPQGDLDLHLRRDTDALCSAADCYALTCADHTLDWGSPESSPRLSADDAGFGPETITLDAPADGTYLVAVHGRALPATGNATVRAFFDGSLLFEGSAAIEDQELWQAAAISCAGGSCVGSTDGAVASLSTCAP